MSTTSPSIAVVVAAYNGESHIAEQLDSILAQDCPNVHVVVRDDGSSDGTLDVLRPYEERGEVTVIAGENVGVMRSFISLVSLVAPEYDYVALSDQDDVWHPDKLSRAVSLLEGQDGSIPQLYCSEYVYCDSDMKPGKRSHLNRIGVSFDTMLYENMVSGNTCVMNRALAMLIAQAGPEGVYCHDWWIGLVACALGNLTFDDFASLDYRRTGRDTSPSGTSGVRLFLRRFNTFFKNGELKRIDLQLRRLEALYSNQLAPERRATLGVFLHGNRLRKAFVPKRLRQKLGDELVVRLLFLVGLL